MFILAIIISGCDIKVSTPNDIAELKSDNAELKTFNSDQELLNAFKEYREKQQESYRGLEQGGFSIAEQATTPTASNGLGILDKAVDYSVTNVQVEGVDEADVIKTDGNYIYYVTNNKLTISRVYPADEAEVLSVKAFSSFNPSEIFIH